MRPVPDSISRIVVRVSMQPRGKLQSNGHCRWMVRWAWEPRDLPPFRQEEAKKEPKFVELAGRVEKKMVGERGFEPPTPWSRTRCSTRLSHSPTWVRRERNSAPRELADELRNYSILGILDLSPKSQTSNHRVTLFSDCCAVISIPRPPNIA